MKKELRALESDGPELELATYSPAVCLLPFMEPQFPHP